MAKTKNHTVLVRVSVGLIIFALLAILFLNQNGVLKYLKLKGKYNNLVREKTEAQNKIYKMKMTIDSLRNSTIKKEQVAREKYNMLDKNERAFVFKNKK